MNRPFALLMLSMIWLTTSAYSYADFLYAYEGFSYPAGTPLVSQNGGNGFVDNWVSGGFNAVRTDFTNSQNSLQYNDLVTSGGSAVAASGSTINGIRRAVDANVSLPGTRYLSFLIRRESTLGAFNGFGGLYFDGSLLDIFVGKGATNFWALEDRGGANAVSSNVTADVGASTLIVVKFVTNSTANVNDRFELFVNPVVGAPEPIANAVRDTPSVGRIAQLVLYNSGDYTFDEIRIGDTFASVTPSIAAVPEPSSLGLIAIVGVGLIVQGRRRWSRAMAFPKKPSP